MRKAKTKIIIILSLVILALVVCYFVFFRSGGSTTSADIDGVPVFSLSDQDLTESINVSGNIEAKTAVLENSQSTKCVKVNVSVGQKVNEGDVLFEFDSSELRNEFEKLSRMYNAEHDRNEYTHGINERNLKNAEAEKESILAQEQRKIDAAVKARDNAYSKYDKLNITVNELKANMDNYYALLDGAEPEEYKELYAAYLDAVQSYELVSSERDALSYQLSDYDNNVALAQDSYENAKNAADDNIRNAMDVLEGERYEIASVSQSDMDALQIRINNCTVKAPMSGIVSAVNVNLGSLPTDASLATIVDDSDFSISANLSEANIHKVAPGMKVIIKTVATGDEEIEGEIRYISSVAAPSGDNDVKNFSIVFDIADKSKFEKVYVGMSATVRIILNEVFDTFAVPYDCLVVEGRQAYLMVAVEDGDSYIVDQIPVKTGVESNYYVEVSGDGLYEGMLIVYYPDEVFAGSNITVSME